MRFTMDVDPKDDVITVYDSKDELKADFSSDIILAPVDEAVTVINELNIQCCIVDMLVNHLQHYEDIEDIKYWIKEIREDFE